MFNNILDRHHPRCPAVLVNNDGKLRSLRLHRAEQNAAVHALRHDQSLPYIAAQIERFPAHERREEILHMDKSDDVILVLVADGIARLLFLKDGLDAFGRRIVEVEADHIRARHHDLTCVQLREREYIVDEIRLCAVDETLPVALLHEQADLLLRVRILVLPCHLISEMSADVVCNGIEYPDEGLHDFAKEHHRERDREHDAFHVRDRHGFRRQLAEHDVQ